MIGREIAPEGIGEAAIKYLANDLSVWDKNLRNSDPVPKHFDYRFSITDISNAERE